MLSGFGANSTLCQLSKTYACAMCILSCFLPLLSQSGCLFDAQSLARRASCGQNPMWRLALRPGGRKKRDFHSFMGSKKWLCTPPLNGGLMTFPDNMHRRHPGTLGTGGGSTWRFADLDCRDCGTTRPCQRSVGALAFEKWNCGDVDFFPEGMSGREKR